MICLNGSQLVNRKWWKTGTHVSWLQHSFFHLFFPSKLLGWKPLLVSGKIHHAIFPFSWDMIPHQLTKESLLGLCFGKKKMKNKKGYTEKGERKSLSKEAQIITKNPNPNPNHFIMLSWARSPATIHLRCGSGQRLECRSQSRFLWLDPGGRRQEGQNIRDSLDCLWETCVFPPFQSNPVPRKPSVLGHLHNPSQ